MTIIDLADLKPLSKGIQAILTEEGKFVLVVDTTVQIGTSKKGSPLYALTNGVTGTPFGGGLFLSLLVGRDHRVDSQD